MAAKKSVYDDATEYDVKLMRPISYRGAPLLPRNAHQMNGKTLKAIIAAEGADIVDTAQPR